jgi:hypothetical protein
MIAELILNESRPERLIGQDRRIKRYRGSHIEFY